MDLFADDEIPEWWDGRVYERTLLDRLDWRELIEPLPCGKGIVEVGHISDGATVMMMRYVPFFGFPKHKHPIATRRHDKRCEIAAQYKKTDKALYKKLRKRADQMFKADIKVGTIQKDDVKQMKGWAKVKGYGSMAQTWWEQQKGYVGVRLGAMF